MIDALKFWVSEADIDGYRCDVAGMVPTEFWDQARKELDEIKPVFMLAEAEQADHHTNAFDMSYAWELHHILNSITKGEMDANSIEKYFAKYDTTYPANAYRLNFITNHDENSWNGTVKERMGDAGNLYAISTIGSILGVFLAGFYLIPNFKITNILLLLSIVLIAVSLFLNSIHRFYFRNQIPK